MPLSPKHLEEKPYNMCLNCVHIGKNCDGPNFLAMNMKRLSEWCKLRKEYLHSHDSKWTNLYISEASDTSKNSVDRFLAGNVEDIKMSTAARIVKVLINGSWGQYPCAMSSLAEQETVYIDNPALINKNEQLQAALDTQAADNKLQIDFLKEQIKFKEEQMKEKDKLLDERRDYLKRKDRYILALSIAFVFVLALLLVLLAVDFLNPNVGFFWIDELFNKFSAMPKNVASLFKM